MDEADDTLWTEDLTWAGARAWRRAGRDSDWLDSTADNLCTWWTGTHRPNWAWDGVGFGPLFISATALRKRKSPFPRATVPVAIDSGGFTEVTKHGGWTISPRDYVALIRRVHAELGNVAWAAAQDWMCEDVALRSTGLTVKDHQRLTVENYLDLLGLAPDIRWLPALQGRTVDDYLRHLDDYDRAGVDLRAHQLVGVGSVCRRDSVREIVEIVTAIAARGVRLHGFGVKTKSLPAIADLLGSADSLAWSYNGMKLTQRQGKTDSQGRNLANSPEHAERFRNKMLKLIADAAARDHDAMMTILDNNAKPIAVCPPAALSVSLPPADFSSCKRYRYTLPRVVGVGFGHLVWIMLNPSTADDEQDDPTIRRCLGFAARLGFTTMTVVNLFAWRSTDPKQLRQTPDPIGPRNDQVILRACEQADLVIAAWGAHGGYLNRDREVRLLLGRAGITPVCLTKTKSGHPRHPLMLKADVPVEALLPLRHSS